MRQWMNKQMNSQVNEPACLAFLIWQMIFLHDVQLPFQINKPWKNKNNQILIIAASKTVPPKIIDYSLSHGL